MGQGSCTMAKPDDGQELFHALLAGGHLYQQHPCRAQYSVITNVCSQPNMLWIAMRFSVRSERAYSIDTILRIGAPVAL